MVILQITNLIVQKLPLHKEFELTFVKILIWTSSIFFNFTNPQYISAVFKRNCSSNN